MNRPTDPILLDTRYFPTRKINQVLSGKPQTGRGTPKRLCTLSNVQVNPMLRDRHHHQQAHHHLHRMLPFIQNVVRHHQ